MLTSYNDSPTVQFFPPEALFPFTGSTMTVGSAITQISDDSFIIEETGIYRVEYIIVPFGFSGSIAVTVNGITVPPVLSPSAEPENLVVGDVTFTANLGDIVALMILSEQNILLPAGNNATITITQVSGPPPL